LPLEFLTDIAQPSRHRNLPPDVRVVAAASSGRSSAPQPCAGRDGHRPLFGNEQLRFMTRHFEHISDAVSRQVHAVDTVREPTRQSNPHARTRSTGGGRLDFVATVYGILAPASRLCSENQCAAVEIAPNDGSTMNWSNYHAELSSR
jgi:hypothetical protein